MWWGVGRNEGTDCRIDVSPFSALVRLWLLVGAFGVATSTRGRESAVLYRCRSKLVLQLRLRLTKKCFPLVTRASDARLARRPR